MTIPRSSALALTMTLICGSTPIPVLGQELGFLEHSPVRYFTDKDWEMSDVTLLGALERGDGETLKWRNEESGNSGSVTAISRFERDGRVCRRVAVMYEAKGTSSRSLMDMCRFGDEWKVVALPE